MYLYSTKTPSITADLKEAVLKGLPQDNGLFMPSVVTRLSDQVLANLLSYDFQEIALAISRNLIGDVVPWADLRDIIENSITFDAPLVKLSESEYVLELFHGPSLAFKDFGARFMARLMSWLIRGEDRELNILVATSGDTGGAVAYGFYDTPGINVVILYPSGKVSHLQEKQLTTLGKNIRAIEVDGTFDDCQAMVKQAFLDGDLNRKMSLSSANSINIARLIPQSFYYFRAWQQLGARFDDNLVFSVPSGNFGNLTAGLIAQKMGLPVKRFLAATNVNDVVPEYLETGVFAPRPGIPTISNAMDVGNPSNFARMQDMFDNDLENFRSHIIGYTVTDDQTKDAIKKVFEDYEYVIDPHGAVGWLALHRYLRDFPGHKGVVLETAHPSKFLDVVNPVLGRKIDVPERLASLADKPKVSTPIQNDYQQFKEALLEGRGE